MHTMIRIFMLAVTLILLANCGDGDGLENRRRGIDVSHYQGDVDWSKVAGSGIAFTFVKATQGVAYTDPKFAHNIESARAAGLLCGAYHFLEPEKDGRSQAQHFLSVARPASGDLRPVVDVETIGKGGGTELLGTLRAFLDEVHARTGVDAIIYVSPAFWNDNLAGLIDAPWPNPLWVAEYEVDTPRTVRKLTAWSIWQHDNTGNVPGITGKTDLNVGRELQELQLP